MGGGRGCRGPVGTGWADGVGVLPLCGMPAPRGPEQELCTSSSFGHLSDSCLRQGHLKPWSPGPHPYLGGSWSGRWGKLCRAGARGDLHQGCRGTGSGRLSPWPRRPRAVYHGDENCSRQAWKSLLPRAGRPRAVFGYSQPQVTTLPSPGDQAGCAAGRAPGTGWRH